MDYVDQFSKEHSIKNSAKATHASMGGGKHRAADEDYLEVYPTLCFAAR